MSAVLLLASDTSLVQEVKALLPTLPAPPRLVVAETLEELKALVRTLDEVELVLTTSPEVGNILPSHVPILGILPPGSPASMDLPCLERPLSAIALQSMRHLIALRTHLPDSGSSGVRPLPPSLSEKAHAANNSLSVLSGYTELLEDFGVDRNIQSDMMHAIKQVSAFIQHVQKKPPFPPDPSL